MTMKFRRIVADADFIDRVELQPEVKRLKLQKTIGILINLSLMRCLLSLHHKNVFMKLWQSLLWSVLEGYNGTVMAYHDW